MAGTTELIAKAAEVPMPTASRPGAIVNLALLLGSPSRTDLVPTSIIELRGRWAHPSTVLHGASAVE
jgi:hypothetical protein